MTKERNCAIPLLRRLLCARKLMELDSDRPSPAKVAVTTRLVRQHSFCSSAWYRPWFSPEEATKSLRWVSERASRLRIRSSEDTKPLSCLLGPRGSQKRMKDHARNITGTSIGKGRLTQRHGLMVHKFTRTNTSALIGRRLTTRTRTAWTIGARIFMESRLSPAKMAAVRTRSVRRRSFSDRSTGGGICARSKLEEGGFPSSEVDSCLKHTPGV